MANPKVRGPVIIAKKYQREMVEERVNAVEEIKQMKNTKSTPQDIAYNLSMLDAFDKTIRPTVPINVKINKNRKYTPIQLYETMLGYFHTALANGRNITIGHLSWFCGYNKTEFSELINDKNLDPNYAFLKDFIAFLEGHMENVAQDKQNPAFHIFWLKNRGWKDTYTVEPGANPAALTEEERAANQKRIAEFSEGLIKPDGVK